LSNSFHNTSMYIEQSGMTNHNSRFIIIVVIIIIIIIII
jgi:hypothetical protein